MACRPVLSHVIKSIIFEHYKQLPRLVSKDAKISAGVYVD